MQSGLRLNHKFLFSRLCKAKVSMNLLGEFSDLQSESTNREILFHFFKEILIALSVVNISENFLIQ